MAKYAITYRAVTEPAPGTVGEVWKSDGFCDYDSAEYGAWMFQPIGEDVAYYIAAEDLEFFGTLEQARASVQ